ncbi:MAG TPA: phosphoribosylanthranilate isomerase [Candidatus Bacteroides intestinavium]|uniref:N-(5'-phosphoribosyl)anthranilate isomerase n=1 Tax=Candidatus Bacteroides intestinavium TaxID=2838469 RepID=A0A9D2KUL1_9BACE|nr:phosphoribosylanthranilate isomerase [Candidatus Bacteroides intestinavium]
MKTQRYLIKVCGMTQGDNIREIEALGVDLIGFNFYPKSPRCLSQMPDYLPQQARRVGVFVNQPKEEVTMYADRFGLDYLQLHGTESPGYCRTLQAAGFHLIKVFSIARAKDLERIHEYEGLCEYFLFDTKTPRYGGSGEQFDWSLLRHYHGRTPFLLGGGINAYSAKAIHALRHPQLAGVDLNSRFELSPGIKDAERVRNFIKELNG